MRISIRWKRAEEVFGNLLYAYEHKLPPYNNMRLPHDEENLPRTMERGGLEHALFLFCVCYYMRGGIKSRTAVRALARFYDTWPEAFRPETFVVCNATALTQKIRAHLKSEGLAFHSKQASEFWVLNFQKLARHWNGDPRNLFGPRPVYDRLCKNIIRGKYGKKREPDESFLSQKYGFYGFRKKMVSMLTYYFVDSGLVPGFLHPVPVDMHVMRVLIINEVLIPETLNGEGIDAHHVEEYGRQITLWYCKKHGGDPIKLCNVLWFLSERFCKRQIGNSSSTGGYRARSTVVKPKPVVWNTSTKKHYREVCGSCSVQRTCRWNIPAQRYYRHGRLFIRGERPKPPQLELFE